MTGRIAALKSFYREAKYEVWDTLSPEARNRIHGCYTVFEGAALTAFVMSVTTTPRPPLRIIAVTALGSGYIALRNYLKQPSRVVLTPAERDIVRDKLNANAGI